MIQSRPLNVMPHIIHMLSTDIHDIDAQEVARNPRKRHIDVNAQLLPSRSIHDEIVIEADSTVVEEGIDSEKGDEDEGG